MSGIENKKDFFEQALELVSNQFEKLTTSQKEIAKKEMTPPVVEEIRPSQRPYSLSAQKQRSCPSAENHFLTRLGEWKNQPKKWAPIHQFRSSLKDLKQCSEKGDLEGWNGLLRDLHVFAKAADIDPAKDLATMGELMMGEMNLLLNHLTKKIIPEREACLQNEKRAREANRFEEAEEFSAQIRKLNQVAQWLEEQILEKTRLVLV